MSRSSKNHPIVHLTVSAADSTDDKRLQTALVEIASQDLTVSIISQQMRSPTLLRERAHHTLNPSVIAFATNTTLRSTLVS
jgi:hypothetical protein